VAPGSSVPQLEASAKPRDPDIAALVGELSTVSREFRTWWSAPNPQTRTTGSKRFRHPVGGDLTIDWEAFIVPDEPAHTLFIYSAADQASEQALRLLASWRATQRADDQAAHGRRLDRAECPSRVRRVEQLYGQRLMSVWLASP
jgi:hypothetical protein